MLGFDALGALALGELPSISSGPLFSTFSQPLPVAPSMKVFLHPPVSFEVENPKAFNPPTTGPLVFTKFSEPLFLKKVTVNLNTNVEFRILRPDSATPGSLVFTRFSEPSFKAPNQSSVSFVFVPPVQTPVFARFSEPSFNKTRQPSDTANNLFQAPAAVTVTVGGDFADFDLVQSKKGQQQGFTGFIFNPPGLTPVFSDFGIVPFKKPVNEGKISFNGSLGPAQTPPWFVFTQFKEVLSKKPQLDPTGLFLGDRGPAQTPPWFVFSSFEQPRPKAYLQTEVLEAFAPSIQSYVFSTFGQPTSRRIIQQDNSFVSFPVVVAAVQPYVFGPFEQPVTKRTLQQDSSFVTFPVVQVVTQPYVFSDFGMPKKAGFIQQDFLSTPVALATQNYVFGQFSQPQPIRVIRESFTNTPSAPFIQNYVFSPFDQPTRGRVIQQDSSFVTFPVVVVAQQPYIFEAFDQPIFRRAPQFDTSVQYRILPPVQVIQTVNFTGFSDFGRTYVPVKIDLGGITYEIFVPVTPVPEEQLAAWRPNKYLWPNKTVKLESSNVEEMELDPNTGELTVKFKGGREYIYNNVELNRAKGLERTKSPGKYINTKIRGKYPTIRTR